ncbi:MAG: hypothetical protein JKY92_05760 [Magnetovibrio sp.]|nr:hypothetical protein [Magnetovibrio sp.]
MSERIFSPFSLNDLLLSNHMVMATMTRYRADQNGHVTDRMGTHCQHRASAGLMNAEPTPVCAAANGYPYTPGIFTHDQAASWRRLTDAVHVADVHIFV